MDGVDEVTEVAAKAIELPNNQRVAFAQRLEAGLQAGPIVLLPGRPILVELAAFTPAAISASRWRSNTCDPSAFEIPHVSDQHTALVSVK
jgi:hypothetical protein